MIEDSFKQTLFSIPSPYSLDFLDHQKDLFTKERSKVLWIMQNEKVLGKIHFHLLEGEFEQTLSLFENNALSLPKEIDPSIIDIIIKYFYFKEINYIALFNIFQMLKLSFFLKLNEMNSKILEFLKMNLTDIKKVLFIRENTYEFLFFFKEEGKKLLETIIDDCSVFLIKGKYFEDFMNQFNNVFFLKINDLIEDEFLYYLKIMKKFRVDNEKIIQFIMIFKNPLINYFMKKYEQFNKEEYFRKIINEYFDLKKMYFQDINSCLQKFTFDIKYSSNDLLIKDLQEIVMDSKKKIEKLEEENEKIKKDYQILQLELDEKISEFKGTLIEIKNLKEIKPKDQINPLDYKIKVENNDNIENEKLNSFLTENFPKLTKKIQLYDSDIHKYTQIDSKIEGKNNVLLLIECKMENLLFGAFYTIPMPKITCKKDSLNFFKDDNSCIFEVNSNKIFKANPNETKHLHTYPNWFYHFGYTGKNDGLYSDFSHVWYGGQKTKQFQGDNRFGFSERKSSLVSKILIYQLNE